MNIRSLVFATIGLTLSIGLTSYSVMKDMRKINAENAAKHSQGAETGSGNTTIPSQAEQEQLAAGQPDGTGTYAAQTGSDQPADFSAVPDGVAARAATSTSAAGSQAAVSGALAALVEQGAVLQTCAQSQNADFTGCTVSSQSVTVMWAGPKGYELQMVGPDSVDYRLRLVDGHECRAIGSDSSNCAAWQA